MPARRRLPLFAALAVTLTAGAARGQDAARGSFFEDAAATAAADWRAETPAGAVARGVRHEPGDGAAADGCAEAEWEVAAEEAVLRFVRPVPPSAAIEDLTATVAVLTPHRAAACVRVVFPHAVDPATGAPPFAWVAGEPVDPDETFARGWAPLSVAATDRRVDDARRRVRFALRSPDRPADLSDPLVDRAGVVLWATKGRAGVRCDDLRFGPLVPVAGVGPADAVEIVQRASVRGGRMTVDGDAFFPRLTYHHGTDPAALKAAGFNLIQTRDWRDTATLASLEAAGLLVAAMPPQAGEAGAGLADINAPADAGLAPFTAATDPIVVWHLDPRFPNWPGVPDQVRKWVADVRAADAARRRPVLFGVVEREFEYSRTADMLAVSRFVCGTALPLWEHSRLLREAVERKVKPGEPVFTWVQTGPHRRTRLTRSAAGLPAAVIEPELIERQALAAVAAGVKGLGFHLDETQVLDDATPARKETRLALTLTNARLAAVEPILAGATRCEPIAVRPRTEGDPAAAARVRGRSGGGQAFRGSGFGTGGFGDGGFGGGGRDETVADTFGGGTFATGAAENPAEHRPRGVCEGALLHRGSDRLVVAVWQGEHDQFVPGPAPFTAAEVTIPGALPTAAAWVITPVGLSNVPHAFVAGGMKVELPRFDGTALLLVTPDHASAAALRRRVARNAPGAAVAAVELANLKLERTKITGASLRAGVSNTRLLDAYLRSADGHLAKAARAVRLRDYDVAYAEAERCKRFCRAVQRAHWDRLAEPPALARRAESPFTPAPRAADRQPRTSSRSPRCRTTWRCSAGSRRGGGRTVRTSSLLAPGDGLGGEPTARAVSSRTNLGEEPVVSPRQYSSAPESVQATATKTADGGVRLAASLRTGFPQPDLLPRGLMTVRTPPGSVPADRAAVIRGQVSVAAPISYGKNREGEGVTVHDSRGGALAGLRWTGREPEFRGGGWVPFELVRPFPAPGEEHEPLTVFLQLHGLGVAQVPPIGGGRAGPRPRRRQSRRGPAAPPPRGARRPGCSTASRPRSGGDGGAARGEGNRATADHAAAVPALAPPPIDLSREKSAPPSGDGEPGDRESGGVDKSTERVRDMFAAIAGRYDLLNRVMTGGLDVLWRRRIGAADVGAGPVLDACCGTGDLAFALKKAAAGVAGRRGGLHARDACPGRRQRPAGGAWSGWRGTARPCRSPTGRSPPRPWGSACGTSRTPAAACGNCIACWPPAGCWSCWRRAARGTGWSGRCSRRSSGASCRRSAAC